MKGKAKIGYIIGAVIIGIIAILAVYFALIGFGVVDYRKEKLIFVSESAIKEYDGDPLMCHLYNITEGKLRSGHTAEIEFSGSQTEVGVGNNNFTVVIKDANDKDVTDNYAIELQPGTLTVNKREIALQSHSAQKVYDGERLSNENADVVAGSLVDGHTLKTSGFASIEKGVASNTFVAAIENENGETVTSSYNITYIFGDLTVSRIPISIRAVGAQKDYDGTPLTSDDFVMRSGALLRGHSVVDVTCIGSQMFVGTSENNIVSARVVDEDGNDQSDIYDISYFPGELEVTPRTITILPTGAKKTYDGKELKATNGEIISGSLAPGDTEEYISSTAITDVDIVPIEMTLKVTNADGEDVSDCYTVKIGVSAVGEVSKLEITPRPIILRSQDFFSQFDGQYHYNHDACDVLGTYPLVEGHRIVCDFYNAIIFTGSLPNTFVAHIFDGDTDVTENYSITDIPGSLELTPYKIWIASNSFSWYYGEDPMDYVEEGANDYRSYNWSGVLPQGHELYITFTTNHTVDEVGKFENTFHAEIWGPLAGMDYDFTECYDIDTTYGWITIYEREITVTSDSDEMPYTGSELTAPGYDFELTDPDKLVRKFTLVDGHELIVDVTGSRTDVGWDYNTIGSIDIVDRNNKDKLVTYNYKITEVLGTLTVFEERGESDLDETGRLGVPDPEEHDVIDFVTDSSQTLYFRYKSFGAYNGKGFDDADPYGELLSDAYSANYLTSLALAHTPPVTVSFSNAVTNNYLLPYNIIFGGAYDGGYEVQTNDVLNYGDPSTDYTVTCYPYVYTVGMSSFIKGYGSYGGYGIGAYQAARTQYANTDGLSDELKEILDNIKIDNELVNTDPYVISKIATIVKRYYEQFNKEATDEVNDADDIVLAFFTMNNNGGNYRHYAAAATLLYRYMGIPARYVIGYKVSDPQPRVKQTLLTTSVHTWVEVFIDGIGWVMVDVLGDEYVSDDYQGTVTLKPEDISRVWNGDANDTLTFDHQSNSIQGLYNLMRDGYSYKVTVVGKQVGPGKSESTILDFVLYDETGKDITYNYDIRFRSGTLQLFIGTVTVSSGSYEKDFDGNRFENLPANDCTVRDLPAGYTYKSVSTASATAVGSTPNSYSVQIFDNDGTDVTDLFKVVTAFGTLTINPCAIVITTEGHIWPSDAEGKENKWEEYEITYANGEPVPDDFTNRFKFEMDFTSISESGQRCRNEVSNISIYDNYAGSADVTSMFTITVNPGWLEIELL